MSHHQERIGAFVTNHGVTPIDVSTFDDERWSPGSMWLEIHTGLGGLRIPWVAAEPRPPLGTNVRLTIEWDNE